MLIMVLNDGETFTDIDGCTIVQVPDGDVESTEEFLRTNENYVCRFETITQGAAIYDGDTLLVTIVPD